jgi:hypothetical protein
MPPEIGARIDVAADKHRNKIKDAQAKAKKGGAQ